MTKQVTTSFIEEMANSFGWSANFSGRFNETNLDVEFEAYTDYGQDVIVSVIVPNVFTIGQLAEELDEYSRNFDVDEQTALWIGDDGHGANGAPYAISDILKDMRQAGKMIDRLARRFASKSNMKKYANLIVAAA